MFVGVKPSMALLSQIYAYFPDFHLPHSRLHLLLEGGVVRALDGMVESRGGFPEALAYEGRVGGQPPPPSSHALAEKVSNRFSAAILEGDKVDALTVRIELLNSSSL